MTRGNVPLWRKNGAWKPSRRHRAAIDCVARMYGIDLADLVSGKRPWKFSRPRQVACWMLRQVFPSLSFSMIAESVNICDHSTVIHAKNCVERRRRENPEYREQTDAVLAAVRACLEDVGQVPEPFEHVRARLGAELAAAKREAPSAMGPIEKNSDSPTAAIQADIDAEADQRLAEWKKRTEMPV